MDPRLSAHLDLAALDDADFVERAYRTILRRDPDEEARERALTRLADKSMSRATLLAELATSAEFTRVRALDDGIAAAAGARARGEVLRGLTAPTGDERAIEIPWALARYRGEQRVLDVGHANAEAAYLAALANLGASELVGVDLAEAHIPGVHTVAADVRDLPFEDGSFDFVLCISTIEHVGADNAVYGVAGAPQENGILRGLRELGRVAAHDARIVVTVPTGEDEDHGWFAQLEPAGWRSRFDAAGLALEEEEIYELGPGGWRSAPDFAPAGVAYASRGPSASAVLCAVLRSVRAGASPRGA